MCFDKNIFVYASEAKENKLTNLFGSNFFYLLNYFKEKLKSKHLTLNSCSVRMQYSARNVNISKIITLLYSWGGIMKGIILI